MRAPICRLQVWSDLHDEHVQHKYGRAPGAALTVDPSADVLVLAGDIQSGDASWTYARDLAQKAGKPVVWVPGNHEFYGHDLERQMERYRTLAAQDRTVVALLDAEARVHGVRFLGGVLWTDFRLYEGAARLQTVSAAMRASGNGLNDFKIIQYQGHPFTPEDSARLHEQTRAYLRAKLSEPFQGPTVVVTHHGVHRRSIHRNFAADERILGSPVRLPNERSGWTLSPGFASNLIDLLRYADVWVHGHVHNSCDYTVAGCRVVANPRGYPLGADSTGHLVFENDEHDPQKVIAVHGRIQHDRAPY